MLRTLVNSKLNLPAMQQQLEFEPPGSESEWYPAGTRVPATDRAMSGKFESTFPELSQRLPLVSVGMPVYNGTPWVQRALSTLAAQDYPNFELIISDNASTDETARICQEYAVRDPRVRYVRNASNVGAGRNFVRVLALANGEYFMWAAHDDLWEPSFISNLVTCFLRNRDLVHAMTLYDRFSHVTDEWGTIPAEGYPAINEANGVYENCCAYVSKGSPELIYGLFRTDVLRKTRFLQLRYFDFGDVFLINEMCTQGKMHLVPKILFHTGCVGPRPVKSLSRWCLPGFKLSYGAYFRESARCFLCSSNLSLVQKQYLLWKLSLQIPHMIYHYEQLPSWVRLTMQGAAAMLRFVRQFRHAR